MPTVHKLPVVVSTRQPSGVKGDFLVVPVFANEDIAVSLPPVAKRQLVAAMKRLEFSGHWGSAELVVAPKGFSTTFVGFVGLGQKNENGHRQSEGLRRGLGRIFQDARRHMLHQAVVVLPADSDHAALAAAAVEAATLSNYRFTTYKKVLKREQEQRALRNLTLITSREKLHQVEIAVDEAKAVMEGVTLARDLVNQPASHASPAALVEVAQKIAKQSKRVEISIYDQLEAANLGFNAFLAVARGSTQEPYVIHLVFRPKEQARHRVALVGKGVTFDSGGLSLKPAQGMTDMKIDMAGAATVFGVFSVLTKLNIPVEVHGIVAACENMPSGNAYRPGDVLRAMNGKTIEVQNTDAEGRITLADALSYAIKQPVDAVIDLATLTGACMVALGETHAGLWTNDAALGQELLAAAAATGEGLVALPLPEEYRPTIQSSVADLSNAPPNSPLGGAITAALFLQEFVGKKPWAHLDVAGPAYYNKQMLSYFSPGASGYGVRTLLSYLQAKAAN